MFMTGVLCTVCGAQVYFMSVTELLSCSYLLKLKIHFHDVLNDPCDETFLGYHAMTITSDLIHFFSGLETTIIWKCLCNQFIWTVISLSLGLQLQSRWCGKWWTELWSDNRAVSVSSVRVNYKLVNHNIRGSFKKFRYERLFMCKNKICFTDFIHTYSVSYHTSTCEISKETNTDQFCYWHSK